LLNDDFSLKHKQIASKTNNRNLEVGLAAKNQTVFFSFAQRIAFNLFILRLKNYHCCMAFIIIAIFNNNPIHNKLFSIDTI